MKRVNITTLFYACVLFTILIVVGCSPKHPFNNQNLTNEDLNAIYPAARDKAKANYTLADRFSPKDIKQKSKGKLDYVGVNKTLQLGVFRCAGREVTEILYHVSSSGNGEGGWTTTRIIDCDDTYYIYIFGDAGWGPLFGPFKK